MTKNEKVIHITGADQFKSEVLDFKGVVIVDFRAEWCGPCRMLGPILEELSDDYQGKSVKVVKLDMEEADNTELAQKFQVISIPAVFILKDGEVKDNVVGANPKEVYAQKIDNLLDAVDVN